MDDHVVLTIQKDILMDNSRDFYLEFEASVEDVSIRQISLNFGEIKYVDSSGIGSLIKLTTICKNKGRSMNVFNLNKALSSVFKLAGLHNVIVVLKKEEFLDKYPHFKEAIG